MDFDEEEPTQMELNPNPALRTDVPACWGLGGMRYRVQLCELRKRGLKGHFQSRPKLPI